jgi:hypothetical protein
MSVIEFPGHDRPITKDEIDKLHSEAFRDLEGDLCDCLRMSEVAMRVMPDETDEHLMFAVLQTKDMLGRLKERYYALWHGEERPA